MGTLVYILVGGKLGRDTRGGGNLVVRSGL